jgi:hypothetical protein
MAGIFNRWLDARKNAAAKRAKLQVLFESFLRDFESFLRDTEPFVTQGSKYRDAALYRHAWRRAAILEYLYDKFSDNDPDDQANVEKYRMFKKLAEGKYDRVAPTNAYGKVRLGIGEKAVKRLLDFEIGRLLPTENGQPSRVRPSIRMYLYWRV